MNSRKAILLLLALASALLLAACGHAGHGYRHPGAYPGDRSAADAPGGYQAYRTCPYGW